MTIEIKELLEHNEELLQRMQVEILPADVPMQIDPENDFWFIAYQRGKLAGFGGIRRESQDQWYLCRAGVYPRYAGMGIQKMLINARIEAAAGAGAKTIITECRSVNYASANSLIACGFKLFEPLIFWGLPDSIYWRKDL